jgi:vacuolar-type H+-ATPase subunit I/STV1
MIQVILTVVAVSIVGYSLSLVFRFKKYNGRNKRALGRRNKEIADLKRSIAEEIRQFKSMRKDFMKEINSLVNKNKVSENRIEHLSKYRDELKSLHIKEVKKLSKEKAESERQLKNLTEEYGQNKRFNATLIIKNSKLEDENKGLLNLV